LLLTEFDPEGCAACGMTTNPENAYRNGTLYSSYTASSFARLFDLAERYRVNLLGVTSWSFEFEGQPWFNGFRDLATNGVDKPVLNVFRMYGMMKGDRLKVVNKKEVSLDSMLRHSVRGKNPDVHALATADKGSASIMVWNYHDADIRRVDAALRIVVKGIPAEKILMSHYRIDSAHSNSYVVWKKMGSPQKVSDEQFRQLEKAGQLALLRSPQWITTPKGEGVFEFSLPSQGISLLRLDFE
jgi:xylan 1,4-beta-xylosidase